MPIYYSHRTINLHAFFYNENKNHHIYLTFSSFVFLHNDRRVCIYYQSISDENLIHLKKNVWSYFGLFPSFHRFERRIFL